MRGSEWIEQLAEKPGPTRDSAILKAVAANEVVVDWTALEYVRAAGDGKPHAVVLLVSQDALRVGELGDSVRVAGSARLHQLVADVMGCVLPTALISDLCWSKSLRLPPCPQTPDSAMGFTSRFVKHHEAIEAARAGRQGIVASFKDWVLCRAAEQKPGRAANYGWHAVGAQFASATMPGVKVLQPLATAHNVDHVDYSQMMRLVRRSCWIDGERRDLSNVLKDPNLSLLVSHEGPLKDRYEVQQPAMVSEVPPAPPPNDGEEDDEVTGVHRPTPYSTEWRNLKRGMTGPDVKAWQELLDRDGYSLAPYGADGSFGQLTEKRTLQWQVDRGVPATGVVDVVTKRSIGAAPQPAPVSTATAERVLEAANYTKANRSKIDWIVVHTMEAAEKGDTAESIAAWFAGKRGPAPKASAHACVDSDSLIVGVLPQHVAWAAPGANGVGYQIEHAGYAKQTREQWLDDYSMSMLKLSAKHAARIARDYGVPVEFVDAAGLKAGRRGFTEHRQVSLAFRKSDHWDPGRFWPWKEYLDLVRRYMEELTYASAL